MNEILQQLATLGPGIAAGVRGNGAAMKAFMEGYQQTLAQLEEKKRAEQMMAIQGEDRALRLDDRQRGITRQGEADARSAEDRARHLAMERVQIAPMLAEAGSVADSPEGAESSIDQLFQMLAPTFGGAEALAPVRDQAIGMAGRTITGRQKKQVEAYVDAALKTSFVADNPDSDPELIQLPEHIVKIIGKPAAKLSELQTFAQLPVGKPAGKTRVPAAVGSFEDYVERKYGPNPTPEQITEARKVYNQSDDKPTAGSDPEIAELRKDLLRLQVEKAGAPTAPKDPTQAQFTNALYAGRMEQSEPILTKTAPGIVGMALPSFTLQTDSWFAKPTFQSAAVQSYMQAARNFINAVLRRESGAVISPTEFAEAKQQYLPVPGDTPEALRQKAENRAFVTTSMKRSSGAAYEAPITPPPPAGNSRTAAPGGAPQFIVAVDEKGNIHHAPVGTPLPAGWKLQQ